jgi:hypothetical protein
MVQSKVKSMSKACYDRGPVNQYVLVSSPFGIKGVPSEKFQFDIRRCTLRRNFLCYHWEGCMRSLQCNMEFGYQLSICSGTKENHGKTWSSWPVAGPSGCKMTSSQQSGINYMSPNASPYLFFENITLQNITKIVSVYNLDKHQTAYNTCGRNKCI